MRTFATILVIALLCALAQWFMPWWVIVPVALIVSIFTALKPGRAFVSGFCGVAIWWLIAALWRDIPNHHILSTRMAQLFSLPGYDFFIGLSVFVGGLTGGLAALAGALINRKR